MIRYVVAVAFATVLLAVTLPVVHDAAVVRTQHDITRFAVELDRAAAALETEAAPVQPGTKGARRVVRFWLPAESLTTAGVRFVALCQARGGRTALRYAVGTRHPREYALRTGLRLPEGGLHFSEPGEHAVELGYHARGNGAVVTATLPEGSSTETGPPAACDSSNASGRTTRRGAGASRQSGPPWGHRTPR